MITLRGKELEALARRLELERAQGITCFRCDRRVDHQGRCSVHGVTRPPEMRGDRPAPEPGINPSDVELARTIRERMARDRRRR